MTPPLSVGLFGDWGFGKSFFMKQMQARIAELTEQSRRAGGRRTLYYRNIRQITFNAWHYADANLWASLVSEIFDHLAGDEVGRDEAEANKVRARRAQLIEELEITRAVRRELDVAKGDKASQGIRLSRLRREFGGQPVGDVLSELGKAVGKEARKQVAETQAGLEWLKTEIKLDDPSVEQIRRLADDLHAVGRRWVHVWRLLRVHGMRWWGAVAAAVGVAFLGFGLRWLDSRQPVRCANSYVAVSCRFVPKLGQVL